MHNKLVTILGIVILFLAIGGYFLFEHAASQNSEALGKTILVVRADKIEEGTVIESLADANKLFTAKRIRMADIVPSAIKVSASSARGESVWGTIANVFNPNAYVVAPTDLKGLVGKRITTGLYKNQQVIAAYLVADPIQLRAEQRYFAVETTYEASVGAEVKKGDYVDLWITYTSKDRQGVSEKIIGPLQVVKMKDSAGQEVVNPSDKQMPKVAVFLLTDAQIEAVAERTPFGDVFMVKYGLTPTSPAAITPSAISSPAATSEAGASAVAPHEPK